jgi:hypothetical protein
VPTTDRDRVRVKSTSKKATKMKCKYGSFCHIVGTKACLFFFFFNFTSLEREAGMHGNQSV